MVFPYERVLNSGSVLLSATFGRPCILPAEPHLVAEFGGQPWVSFYEVGDHQADSLARSIAEVAVAQKWHVEELHTEEGRLDEVFRSITLPETLAAKSRQKEDAQ